VFNKLGNCIAIRIEACMCRVMPPDIYEVRKREIEMPLGSVQVIVVPDDNADARNIPPGILAMLGPDTVLVSNDSLRMYVRQTHWEKMKESFTQVTK
jgi:hypothetical protein